MKKLTCIIVFFLGVVSTCIYYHIQVISLASAENPGKQELLYSIAKKMAYSCALGPSLGTLCKDYYQYYIQLGGTNELIYYARTQLSEDERKQTR